MMPGVGLYLPETLHRSDANTSKQSYSERIPTQLYRKTGRSSQDTSVSVSQSSVDKESITSGSATHRFDPTAIVFDYADFVFASNKRSAEAESFASLIWRMRQDPTEAFRLYLSPVVTNFLETWPDRKAWIDRILSDVRTALADVASCIESIRSSRDDDEGSKMKRKFEYILNHQKRLVAKQQAVANYHQVLLGAIQVMQTVEQCIGLGGPVQDPIFEAPVRPWLRSDSDIVRGPYSRRLSSKNSSTLSVKTSDSREAFNVRPPEAPPAELPGSTPDDLIRIDTSRLLSSPRTQKIRLFNTTNVDSPAAVDAPNQSLEESGYLRQETGSFDASQRSSDGFLNRMTTGENVVYRQADWISTPAPSSLNTVVDRIIDRTQSIASTTASIRMPILAKRYRPRPVRVHKPHIRHHSLPSELPPYQSQSSLGDDLRDWMAHTVASDQFTEANLTRSPTGSSMTGSTMSRQETMNMLASFPNVKEEVKPCSVADTVQQGYLTVEDDISSPTNYPLPLSAPSGPPMALKIVHPQEDIALASSFPLPPSQPNSPPLIFGRLHRTPSIVSSRSVSAIGRKPLPLATKGVTSNQSSPSTSPNPQHSELFIDCETTRPLAIYNINNENVYFEPTPESQNIVANTISTKSPASIQSPTPPPTHAQEKDIPYYRPPRSQTKAPASSSPLPQPYQATSDSRPRQISPETQTSSPPPPPQEPTEQETSQLPISLSPQPQSPAPSVPEETGTPTTAPPKAKTAEAKRRAAHAKRMKIAFG